MNFIKSCQLQTRLFKKFCDKMESEHKNLLLHTKIWWSSSLVLTRYFELRNEVKLFLEKYTKTNLCEWFHNKNWLVKLAYLSGIFIKLNETTWINKGKKLQSFKPTIRLSLTLASRSLGQKCTRK